MNTPIKDLLITKKYVIVLAAAIVIVGYYGVNMAVESKLKDLETQLTAQVTKQGDLLASIAESTSRNMGDAATEVIISDCEITQRVRFDDLLGKLDGGLGRADLNELDKLFGRCGSYYSALKAISVFRLNREVEIYKAYVDQLRTVTKDSDVEQFNVAGWEALTTEEKKQSELFSKLVVLQEEIITHLLAGKSAGSDEIVSILQEVREIQETLVVANKQASNLRATLIAQ